MKSTPLRRFALPATLAAMVATACSSTPDQPDVEPIDASAVTAAAQATFEPFALDHEIVDEDAAARLAAIEDTSIYVAAPLFGEDQTIWELSTLLEPRASVSFEDSFIVAMTQVGDALQFIDADCLSDNGGYAFCSTINEIVDGEGVIIDGTGDLRLDHHALLEDPTGNGFWAGRYVEYSCDEDLYPCDYIPEDSEVDRIYDCEIAHFVDGDEVWTWSALESVPESIVAHGAGTPIYNAEDPYHCNAFDYVPEEDLVLASMRHVNSALAIDRETGEIAWTFGAYDGDEALSIEDPEDLLDDERQLLSGNHDIHALGDSRYSVFDNGSAGAGPGRFIIFSVDGTTATIEAVIDDPDANESQCTGSARPVDDDEEFWVVSWGCSISGVTVVTADGDTVVKLTVDREQAVAEEIIASQWAGADNFVGTVSYAAFVGDAGLIAD